MNLIALISISTDYYFTSIEIAQLIQALTAKLDDLHSHPRIHRLKGENQHFHLSSDFHRQTMVSTHIAYTHRHNK